ncbi:Protein-serine/threonine phosphatase [Heracleum sosnowskyi]|uniref:protein-serine/threonine phosphatase n=1 Tax=Heracleum sosnowskyi TaxID=360622 RepID=A0AAD8M888_9APIA|nr:Protein-serine/threonine phosphatase [Heracleum sosnowskyi]
MEEIPPAIEVTVSLSSSICDNSGISSNVEITRVQIVTESSNLLPDPVSVLRAESVSSRERGFNSLKRTLSGTVESERKISVSETVLNGDSSWVSTDAMIQQNKDDVADDCSGIKSKQMLALNASTGISLPIAVEIEEIDNGQIFAKVISLEKQSVEGKMSASADDVSSNILTLKTSVIALQLPKEKITGSEESRGVVHMKYVPLWGHVSICGKRPEMEDAVAAMPQFLEVPTKMIHGDHLTNGMSQNAGLITTHFFGVYDGHGGSQVANYCRDRIHFALKEKLKGVEDDETEAVAVTQQVLWEEIFTSCFQKIDDEVGGKVSQTESGGDCDTSIGNLEPVAPETVGSTAVVALLCSSHIIVANCGDSRAVLYRGKEAMALSNDHKPNREDEYARIEASGGKVIQWNGHRVFGVLAMSRSIGDRYLKPWIIPKPEVMFVARAREDECLILASDGLWDVMTNEEACEVARRRILLWHKKNGPVTDSDRGQGVDPAAQAAAEYLSMLALQKGSKDNISVIVVDLKAQRKFKNKS